MSVLSVLPIFSRKQEVSKELQDPSDAYVWILSEFVDNAIGVGLCTRGMSRVW